MLQPIHIIVGLSTAISGLSGAYWKFTKAAKQKSEDKELEKALIIQQAKEISHKHKEELEAKIEALSQKILNIEESVNKDLSHIKETYNNEVRFLGTQISELKDELRTSLTQVVTLISRLIDKD